MDIHNANISLIQAYHHRRLLLYDLENFTNHSTKNRQIARMDLHGHNLQQDDAVGSGKRARFEFQFPRSASQSSRGGLLERQAYRLVFVVLIFTVIHYERIKMSSSDKQNNPPWMPTFGVRMHRPPGLSPLFGGSLLPRPSNVPNLPRFPFEPLDTSRPMTPGISMLSQRPPTPGFPGFASNLASSVSLQPSRGGCIPGGPPASWIHLPSAQYPSLQRVVGLLEAGLEQQTNVAPVNSTPSMYPPAIGSHRGPLPNWSAPSITGGMGINQGLVMNPARPLSPGGQFSQMSHLWSSTASGTTGSSPVPTRNQLGHAVRAPVINVAVQSMQTAHPGILVPFHGANTVSENQPIDPEQTHVSPNDNDVNQGITGRETAANMKFKTGRPGIRDVHFIRLLSTLNPFNGPGHKLESFGDCARKLKAAPETEAMFAGLSDNNNSKTLLSRFEHLKQLYQTQKWVPVEGGTEEDDIDLRNRLQMLIADEEEYLSQRRDASERRRAVRSAPVLASEAHEAHAQAMASGTVPTPSNDSMTTDGDPVSSENEEDMGPSKRQKKQKTPDVTLTIIRSEMRELDQAAINAQAEQTIGTHKLFAADLALKEKAFEFNSGLRKRELELAERRFEHEVLQAHKTDEKINALKVHFGEQFESLKKLIGQVLSGPSHTGAAASGSS